MKQCAFLSMENRDDFVCYDHLLYEPLASYGWHVDEVAWRNNAVQWDRYEVVIIRSPWDYQHDPQLFLHVLETIDQSSARLENALRIVRWNLDKRYLKEMQNKEIPIVPTLWKNRIESQELSEFFDLLKTDELIIKPVISANAHQTFRINRELNSNTLQDILRIFANRPFMVQPFIENIVSEGEFSLFYFDGEYSHAILKTPKKGDFRVQEEHGGILKRVEPEFALQQRAQKTMKALPETPLYARIDFVRRKEDFALMELELIEPSLYFNMDAKSPIRFAKNFNRRMKKKQIH